MKACIKDYWKDKVLPSAPTPTKPVRIQQDNKTVVELASYPQEEVERRRKIAQQNSIKSRSDVWDRDEVETLRTMARGGYSLEEITACLPRRTVDAVEAKYRRMRKKGEI